MIQISVDLSTLTPHQAHALAGLLLNLHPVDCIDSPDAKPFIPTKLPEMPTDDKSAAEIFGTAPASNIVQMTTPPNLDASGLPWDERIHSGGKALTADGLWRKKRGLQDGEAERVEAELRKLMAIPSPIAPIVPPPPAAEVAPVAAIVPPPPTAIVPPPPVSDVSERQPWIDLLNITSQAIGSSKVTMPEILAIVNKRGVDSLPLLNVRLDLVPEIRAEVDLLIASKG